MNNSNFRYDRRNNLDNCQFIPIFDELKKSCNLKDTTIILTKMFLNL